MDKSPEQITTYLDISSTLPQSANLAFIFGTRHPTPAKMAVELYHDKRIRYIALTGGINRRTGINEARAHLEILKKNSIPSERIILEDQSSNTLENVLFALPNVCALFEPTQFTTMIVITKWHHSRRAVMTLKRHFPERVRYHAWTYEPEGETRKDWWLSEIGRRTVLKEWENIPKYLAKGDIAEID